MTPNVTDWITAISSGIMALAAAVAVLVAYTQLKKLVDANRQAAVVMVVQIEIGMLEARRRIAEVGRLVSSAGASSYSAEHIAMLKNQHEEAKEAYLNLLDRYCASVRRGIVPEDEAKKDYRDQVKGIVRSEEYKKFFGTASTYQNIQKLAEKWSDEA